MAIIDLTIDQERQKRAIQKAKEQNVILPTFAQMENPQLIPAFIKNELKSIGLWDAHPRNLFRITWHNEPVDSGGCFGSVNYLELPSALTGTDARIIALVGKWFPTGAHKVGAAYACLVPRLITGQFDPSAQKTVWPSTGNFCRGGAFDAAVLGCDSVGILPDGMSQERFDWLESVGSEIIRISGRGSMLKEISDKCKELSASGQNIVIFNQFEEFGNYQWHYEITGHAIEETLREVLGPNDSFRGIVLATGSAGTIACGDYLKQIFPASMIIACEALQSPTLLQNGFGSHRIEGIGDNQIPWIHNVRNTDVITAVDDRNVVNVVRLFNEPEGRKYLAEKGIDENFISKLGLIGFSGIANMLSAIKTAGYFEMGKNDVLVMVLTDSMDLYGTRLNEYREKYGLFTASDAARVFAADLMGIKTDSMIELTYPERRRVHNLKYYTWVEQHGKSHQELLDQWYDADYWKGFQKQIPEIDALIDEFNARVGLIKKYTR